MLLKRLEFENFRNLQNGFIQPDTEINVIYGNNAQGKTNLLEAFWLFTGGHSFRGNKDHELPRLENGKNGKSACLTANFFSEERDQQASLQILS
ncbi:MAG: AAA family ATPase, partial [Oscillospiraceae bacterium]